MENKQRYVPLLIALIAVMLITNIGPLVSDFFLDQTNYRAQGVYNMFMVIGQAVFILGAYWYMSMAAPNKWWWIPIILFQFTVIWNLYGDILLDWMFVDDDNFIYISVSYALILVHYVAIATILFFISEDQQNCSLSPIALKVLSYTVLGEVIFDLVGFFLSYVHRSELWQTLEVLHSISYFQLAIVFVLVVEIVELKGEKE